MNAKTRIKCPKCGESFDLEGAPVCPKCRQPIEVSEQGSIYLYRQGSPYGIAGGFGVYINNEPYGYIGNKGLLRFPLPYGTYTLHSAVGMSRKCKDMQITLSPENNVAYAKVYIKPGFWANSFVIEPLDPKLLEK